MVDRVPQSRPCLGTGRRREDLWRRPTANWPGSKPRSVARTFPCKTQAKSAWLSAQSLEKDGQALIIDEGHLSRHRPLDQIEAEGRLDRHLCDPDQRAGGVPGRRTNGSGLQTPLTCRTSVPIPEERRSGHSTDPALGRGQGARSCLPVYARLSCRVAPAGGISRRCCSTTPIWHRPKQSELLWLRRPNRRTPSSLKATKRTARMSASDQLSRPYGGESQVASVIMPFLRENFGLDYRSGIMVGDVPIPPFPSIRLLP